MNPVSIRRRMRQRGSILLQASVVLLVCVIALAGTELGYLFFVKREMQKAADLAALAGAQTLAQSGCTAGGAAATTNATQNLQSIGFTPTITPTCGTWDAASTAPQHFVAGGSQPNALKVLIGGTGPTLLPFLEARTVATEAIAANGQPLAAFSVGSRLARVTGDSTLGAALKGIGLNPAISLVSYDGLANAKITPGGLLGALGIPVATDINVGQLNALLAANQVGLGQLLDAAVTLAGQSALTAANVTLLNAVGAKVGNIPLNVQLGSLTDVPTGLFAKVVAPDSTTASALNTQISALDIISSAIGVATSKHAIETGIGAEIPLVAKITSKVGIVEPPSIAIGGVGATAYTAQVRTFVSVKTEGFVAGLLAPLIKLDLPIVLDVVTGKGTITQMCTPALKDASGKDGAIVNVESSVAKVCVGAIATADLFSKSMVCEENLGNMELLNVLGILRLPNNKLNIDVLENPPKPLVLREGDTQPTENELNIGTTVDGLVTKLLGLLFGAPDSAPSTTPTSAQIDALRDQIWADTLGVCSASTPACRGDRLAAAKSRIEKNATDSGLLAGLLEGVGNLLTNVLNDCTGLLYLGGSEAGCKKMLRSTLADSSSKPGGGMVSNGLTVLTGLLKPVLNAVGNSVLKPILNNVLGLHLGETDVKMMSLQCGGTARLVY